MRIFHQYFSTKSKVCTISLSGLWYEPIDNKGQKNQTTQCRYDIYKLEQYFPDVRQGQLKNPPHHKLGYMYQSELIKNN